MEPLLAEHLERDFGYVPQEADGERWVVFQDHTLIVIHPYRAPKLYRRGALNANDYCKIVPPW